LTDPTASGPKVKELQALLIYHGYSVGSTGVDGYFGAGTEAAVKRYQAAEKLRVDGIVSTATWRSLRA
jgi:peptidoglycan hydrolase-like protein with peptidoglycan-binding domain